MTTEKTNLNEQVDFSKALRDFKNGMQGLKRALIGQGSKAGAPDVTKGGTPAAGVAQSAQPQQSSGSTPGQSTAQGSKNATGDTNGEEDQVAVVKKAVPKITDRTANSFIVALQKAGYKIVKA
jgi:hypothetical protein